MTKSSHRKSRVYNMQSYQDLTSTMTSFCWQNHAIIDIRTSRSCFISQYNVLKIKFNESWNKLGELCSPMDLIREPSSTHLSMSILINATHDLLANLPVIKTKHTMTHSLFRPFMKEWELREMKTLELVSGGDKRALILKACWCFG